ncbi:hypothetical protein ABIC84_002818 [Mucilaginibacter sp. 3215]
MDRGGGLGNQFLKVGILTLGLCLLNYVKFRKF